MPSLSLFHKLLGASFEELPAEIRRVHAGERSVWFNGECAIEHGRHWLANLAARIARMPPATSRCALRIEIAADTVGETWNRYFGDHPMSSRLRADRGLLVEQLGPLTIAFQLQANSQQIAWTPQWGRVLGIALPASFFAGVVARESMLDGRYYFEVQAALPVVGLVISYRGWLAN